MLDIAKKNGINDIVHNYDKCVEYVEKAFEMLKTAQKYLSLNYTENMYSHIIQPHTDFYSLDTALSQTLLELKKNTWIRIIELSDIKRFLTVAKRENLDEQLHKKYKDLPDITHGIITSTLEQYVNNTTGLFNETGKEVFNWLLPTLHNKHKTNKASRIGKKIIKTNIVDDYGVTYYQQKYMIAFDNAMHLLDGKGVSKYPNDICTKIYEQIHRCNDTYENDYYICKWFINRNLHITFKRLDLLEKLNQFGSNNTLAEESNK